MKKISIEVWTEKFLGTSAKCEEFLTLLETLDGGKWRPEKWSQCEPVRSPYGPEAYGSIQAEWTVARGDWSSSEMFFRRKKPSCEFWVSTWRGKRGHLNSIRLTFEARAFSGTDGVERLKAIVLRLIEWSQAAYATASRSEQVHWRVAGGRPSDRLENMDWLTFFGKPYLELFGGEDRVLAAPCFQAEKVSGGVLLLAAALPDSPEMTELDQALIALEQYLGVDAFASEHYPEVPCRVPCFDLSETVLSEGAKPENDAAPDSLEPRVIRDPKTNEPIAVVVLSKE